MFAYIVLEIKKDDYERTTEFVWLYKPLGVEEEDKGEKIIFKVFFENKDRLNEIKNNLPDHKFIQFIEEGFVERKNWIEEWMQQAKPKRIGRDIVIYYDEIRRKQKDKITLNIIPAMAFGTAYHESTILCLKIMHSLNLKNKIILDIGCGTGILSIFALLKGAKKVYAIDIDSFAIKEIIRNALINKCIKKLIIIQGKANCLKNIKFDLIVSNLTEDIILAEMKDIISLLKDKGMWIFSGFTKKSAKKINEKIEVYFSKIQWKTLRGWTAGIAFGKVAQAFLPVKR